MIIYDLKCQGDHKFEGWFKDRSAFEQQKAKKLISCPICGDNDVALLPSSMTILGRGSHSVSVNTEQELMQKNIVMQIQEYVYKHFDNVEDKFAEVALRIHHGEEDRRNIRGTATGSEEDALREEGIEFIKLPMPKFDS